MKLVDVNSAVAEAQAAGDTILGILEVADPAVAIPAETVKKVLDLAGTLVTKALSAFSAAAGTPITAESVLALLPNATPLSAPDAA